MYMKTRPPVSAPAYLLLGVLSLLLFATLLLGDSWMLPRLVTVWSPSSNYVAQVTTGSGGYFGDYERAITNRERNASAIVSRCPAPSITNVVWSGKLINPVAPVEVYVSDGGYLVTMDNWHEVGYGAVVAIYNPTGRLLRHWSLQELFKPEELLRLTHSVSSIWWHSAKAYFVGGTETNALVVPAVGKEFVFGLTDGTLLMSIDSGTRTNAGGAINRSPPIRSETNRSLPAAGSRR